MIGNRLHTANPQTHKVAQRPIMAATMETEHMEEGHVG